MPSGYRGDNFWIRRSDADSDANASVAEDSVVETGGASRGLFGRMLGYLLSGGLVNHKVADRIGNPKIPQAETGRAFENGSNALKELEKLRIIEEENKKALGSQRKAVQFKARSINTKPPLLDDSQPEEKENFEEMSGLGYQNPIFKSEVGNLTFTDASRAPSGQSSFKQESPSGGSGGVLDQTGVEFHSLRLKNRVPRPKKTERKSYDPGYISEDDSKSLDEVDKQSNQGSRNSGGGDKSDDGSMDTQERDRSRSDVVPISEASQVGSEYTRTPSSSVGDLFEDSRTRAESIVGMEHIVLSQDHATNTTQDLRVARPSVGGGGQGSLLTEQRGDSGVGGQSSGVGTETKKPVQGNGGQGYVKAAWEAFGNVPSKVADSFSQGAGWLVQKVEQVDAAAAEIMNNAGVEEFAEGVVQFTKNGFEQDNPSPTLPETPGPSRRPSQDIPQGDGDGILPPPPVPPSRQLVPPQQKGSEFAAMLAARKEALEVAEIRAVRQKEAERIGKAAGDARRIAEAARLAAARPPLPPAKPTPEDVKAAARRRGGGAPPSPPFGGVPPPLPLPPLPLPPPLSPVPQSPLSSPNARSSIGSHIGKKVSAVQGSFVDMLSFIRNKIDPVDLSVKLEPELDPNALALYYAKGLASQQQELENIKHNLEIYKKRDTQIREDYQAKRNLVNLCRKEHPQYNEVLLEVWYGTKENPGVEPRILDKLNRNNEEITRRLGKIRKLEKALEGKSSSQSPAATSAAGNGSSETKVTPDIGAHVDGLNKNGGVDPKPLGRGF